MFIEVRPREEHAMYLIAADPRELASRSSDGIDVTLFWSQDADRVWISVVDEKTGAWFEQDVHPGRAERLEGSRREQVVTQVPIGHDPDRLTLRIHDRQVSRPCPLHPYHRIEARLRASDRHHLRAHDVSDLHGGHILQHSLAT